MSHLLAALRLPWVVLRYRELLWSFTVRELKGRIHGSILGRVWPILQPTLLFAIYFLIFSKLLKIGFSDDLPPHGEEGLGWRSTFYLITGILPWTCHAESLTRGANVVIENANLIKKIAFPSELLPIYTVIVYHVYFLVGFVILLLLQLFVNGEIPVALVWMPAVLLAQVMFMAGLSMFLAAANVFVRDIAQAVPIALTFWMFTTPVFYDLGAIEKSIVAQGGGPGNDAYDQIQFAQEAMGYNPMANLLDIYRAIFSFGRVEFPVGTYLNFLALSAVILVLSYAFFLRSKGRFADEV